MSEEQREWPDDQALWQTMSEEQREWLWRILTKARADQDLVNYNEATGPVAQLLTAVIALEATWEDPVGIDEENIPEIQEMTLRLLEIWSGEKRPR